MTNSTNIPTHLGFIVDGNRRWARERNLPTLKGHKEGLEKVELICETLAETDVKFASFYLFSTENWNRSEEEVGYLMELAALHIPRLAKKMKKRNVKCIILGSKNRVSSSLLQKFHEAEEITKDCTGLTVCLCFNYGGQQEIVDAARELALQYKEAAHSALHDPSQKQPTPEDFFTIESLNNNIYHPEVPPVDMIIRTSGEERISGFMLWRAAYSEFFFLDKYWPDIEPADVGSIITEYQNRSRRFGK